MRTLHRRNNSLCSGQIFKGFYRLVIGNRDILRAPDAVQIRVLRTDPRIIQASRDGVNLVDLPVLILAEQRFHPVEHAHLSGSYGSRRFAGIYTSSGRLAADQPHFFVRNKVIKSADGIGSASHAGDHRRGELSLFFQNLLPCLFRNNRLEISYNRRKRMRPHDGSKHIVRVLHPAGPLTHGLVYGILQYHGATFYVMHLRSQQLHAVYIQLLALAVQLSHKNFTLHVQKSGNRRRCHPVLSGTGLGDHTGLSHLFGQKDLTEAVIDLVGTGVIQILSFQINFRSTQIGSHFLCFVEQRRPACIIFHQVVQFRHKLRIVFIMLIRLFQMNQLVHQGFRHILSSKFSKSAFRVCHNFLLYLFAPAKNAEDPASLPASGGVSRLPDGPPDFFRVFLPLRLQTAAHIHRIRVKSPDCLCHIIRPQAARQKIRAVHTIQQ